MAAILLASSLIAAAPTAGKATKHSPARSSPKAATGNSEAKAPSRNSHGKTREAEKAERNQPEVKSSSAKASAQNDKVAKSDDTPITDTKAAGGEKPVWEVKTVTPDAVQVAKMTYVVRPGDTLSAVVRKTGEGADVIAHDNDLKPPFVLHPGQKLKIAGGRYHTVERGESGIAIARAYQVQWSKIIELNHLEEPFMLRAGQRLLLPPAQEVAKMTLEQRAAAFKIDLTDLATGSEPALSSTAKAAAATPSPRRNLAPTTPVAEPAATFDGDFDWPAEGKVIRHYGPMGNGGRNDGITIRAERGAPIRAAAKGVVMWVGEHPAFGNVVLIKHGDGWITIYGNADKTLVKRGQSVKAGQTIARAGSTGSSADGQTQTFFEVLQGKKPVNPMSLLPRRSKDSSDDDDTKDGNGNQD